VAGNWRKLHNEALHNLYSLPDIVRVIKSRRLLLAKHVVRVKSRRNEYRIFAGKLGRSRHIWEDSIGTIMKWGVEGVDWINLA